MNKPIMLSLTRAFTLFGLVFVILAAVLLNLFSDRYQTRGLLQQGEARNLQSIRYLVQYHKSDLQQALSSGASDRLRAMTDRNTLAEGISLLRIRLFDSEGDLRFDSAGLQRGEFGSSSGMPLDYSVHTRLEPFGDPALPGRLVRTVTDLSPGGAAWGHIELSTDLTEAWLRSEEQRDDVLILAMVMISLLYLCVLALMRHGDHRVELRHRQLQQSLEELERVKGTLEVSIEERTRELADSNAELAREVEERRSIAETLREQERYMRAIMDNVFNGIVTINAKGIIESFNPTAERMFGYQAEEVLGRSLEMLMPATHRTQHSTYINSYLETGERNILGRMRELNGVRKDGSTFPLEVAITETNFQGRLLFVGTIRDISERQRAERELEETQQKYYHQEKMAAIGTLAAGIVHEIGNPTAAMLGLTQSVIDEHREALPADALANLELIRDQVERVIQITRDISEFSSARSMGAQLVDLNGLIGRTCRLMRHDRRFRQVDLVLDLDQQLPALMAIEDHLIQVVLNLLANAADALEEAGVSEPKIHVSTRLESDVVKLSVEDNGCGMAEEVLEHAMEAFYTTKPVGRGTGLGLSLCHSLICEHQGKLSIDSTPGKGTCIDIRLPVSCMREDAGVVSG